MRKVYILIAVGVAIVAVWGCSEKETDFIVDQDVIKQLLTTAPEAKELFSTAGFFVPHDYNVPFDSGVYRDTMFASSREYAFWIVPSKPESELPDYGSLGRLREAQVRITDRFQIQTTRTYTNTISYDTTTRMIERWAVLLKLGTDNQAYVGWLLWGFNGIGGAVPRVLSEIERYDGTKFRGDLSAYDGTAKGTPQAGLPYITLSSINQVVVGSRIVLRTIGKTGTPTGLYHKVSGRDTSGYFTHQMVEVDTVGIDTIIVSRDTSHRWHNLFVQDFSDASFQYLEGFCIPYQN